MKKMVAISLLQTCMIAGLPRSPVEGVQTVPKDEADRLIDAGMAEKADMDFAGEEDGDGLDGMTVKNLRTLAKTEGAAIEGDANKAAVIAAIRAHREGPAKLREEAKAKLAGFDRAELLKIAEEDEVEVAEDATDDQIRDAIYASTFPSAA